MKQKRKKEIHREKLISYLKVELNMLVVIIAAGAVGVGSRIAITIVVVIVTFSGSITHLFN